VETGARKVRMGEIEGRRSKRGSREKERGKREGEEEEIEKGENDGSKKSSRGVGDMERRGGSSKVRSRGKEVGAGEVS